jgi:hypothetical protein
MHYNGFSSKFPHIVTKKLEIDLYPDSMLWPLLHYQPNVLGFNNCDWESYCQANSALNRTYTLCSLSVHCVQAEEGEPGATACVACANPA